MQHLGDITKLHGADLPPVDCVIGGSPCQDLSVAGKRAGLAGERSGLFMEQIRVIKEMRQNDRENGRTGEFIRPRFMVWENVPGAFTSNKGDDFRAVLEETVRIADPDAVIPRPQNGKWQKAGAIVGDGYSLAWRVYDAQFWGVPQRRKRIALVADFGGQCAPEIQFKPESVFWYPATSQETGQGAAGNSADCTGERLTIPFGIGSYYSNSWLSDNPDSGVYIADTAKALDAINCGYPGCNQGGMAVVCLLNDQGGASINTEDGNVSPTLRAESHQHEPIICIEGNGSRPTHLGDGYKESDVMYTMNSTEVHAVCYDMAHATDVIRDCGDTAPTLQCRMGTGCNQIPLVCNPNDLIVRRLTPLECERLQGYPDGWTDIGDWVDEKGKTHKGESHTPRYKAIGNSIALPCWVHILKGISDQCEGVPLLGSLFDGIGGFPLIWETLNGKGTAVWASEIEEFPMAVTKKRFK